MKHKRIVSMLLAAFMTLSMPLSGYAEKTVEHGASTEVTPYVADTQAPVLNNISISATEVQAGESLTVTIDATDDNSGIENFKAYFINRTNGRRIESDWGYGDDALSTQVYISKYESNGTFELEYIYISDKAGNIIYYGDETAPGTNIQPLPCIRPTFRVINEEEGGGDIIPPVLKNVSLNQTEVSSGNSLTVTIDAMDDNSGIENFKAYFINRTNGRRIESDWGYGDDALSTQVYISKYESNGTFELEYIYISDKAGNIIYYGDETAPGTNIQPLPYIRPTFRVINEEEGGGDIIPPVLKNVSLNQTEVSAGSSLILTIDSIDDNSGVNDFIAYFINRANGRRIESDWGYAEKGSSTKIQISEYEPNGTFELEYVRISDNAKNYVEYTQNPMGEQEKLDIALSFVVFNDDFETPVPTPTPEEKPSNNSGESNTPSSENSNENSSNASSGLSLSINRNEVKQESPKQQSKSIQIKDSKTNITISAPKGVLPEGTTAKVSPISNVASSLSDKLGTFLLYDIKLVDENGNTVQPKGTVTVGIPVPDGFDIDKLVVYYIDEEGNLIEYPVVVKDGVAYFETDHFSYYALAEKQGNSLTTQSTTETQTDSNKPNPSTGAQDLTAVLAAAAVSLMGLVVLGKKKH